MTLSAHGMKSPRLRTALLSRARCTWTSAARAVHGMIKGDLVSGLSIGFKPKASTQQGRNRVISALDLFEISVVHNPSHQLSCSRMRSRNSLRGVVMNISEYAATPLPVANLIWLAVDGESGDAVVS